MIRWQLYGNRAHCTNIEQAEEIDNLMMKYTLTAAGDDDIYNEDNHDE